MRATNNGFHLFNTFFHQSYPETIKTEFVHRLQHLWIYKITLKSDMVIMTDIVGLSCQHLHQEIHALQMAFHFKIDQRINTGYFDNSVEIPISIVLRKRKIM